MGKIHFQPWPRQYLCPSNQKETHVFTAMRIGKKSLSFKRMRKRSHVGRREDLVEIHPLLLVLIIFSISLSFVTLSTIRMILMVKGYQYSAAGLSILEVIINILGLGLVLDNLANVQNLLAYALGFAAGIIVGSKIEDKLSLGYVTANVISQDSSGRLAIQLRDKGYGVTDWETNGYEGKRSSLQILMPKKQEPELYRIVKELDPHAFIVAYDAKTIYGGFWIRALKKRTITVSD